MTAPPSSRPPATTLAAPAAPLDEDVARHRAIGLEAIRRGYLDVDAVIVAMAEVGARPAASPAEVWLRAGRLDRTELAELVAQLQQSSPAVGAIGVRPSVLHHTPVNLSAIEDPNDSINLADVVRTYGAEPRPAPGDANDPPGEIDSRRYLLGGELGRGGVGRVLKAFDRDLGRNVAMKIPLTWPIHPDDAAKFVEEAQATGQLEHPNIVPIYDVGRLESGELYYTMKRVRAHSLRDVIDGLKRRQPEIVNEYGTTRLLSIFLQVCQAVHYAHDRGVVHRDLKPDNIMLGEYGEVHVMDWGLARIIDRAVVTDRSLAGGDRGEVGQTVGTPAYMPPEQAKGQLDLVSERSDVYALGVILYELVTLKQPSTRGNVMATLMAVITEPIVPPSAVAPQAISEEMDHIIMRALEKNPEDRWPSAKALHDAVEKFLDGRNEREATRRVLEGERQTRIFEQAKRDMLEFSERVHQAGSKVEDWQSIEIKRAIWSLEDQRRAAAMQMVTAFGDAIKEFTQALAHVPDFGAARLGLAQLFFSRYELAETEENELDKIYYLSLLQQYDDGRFQGRLHDRAPVSVYTQPAGAAVFLYEFEEADRRLVSGEPSFLGKSPVPEQFLDAGSYLLKVKHQSRPAVSIPLHVNRSDPFAVSLDLPVAESYRPGFVYIPAGQTIVGGDPEAFDPLPMSRVDVDSFYMQRYPVTFADYVEFLDAIAAKDPEQAAEHAPRARGGEAKLVELDPATGKYTPSDVLIDGDMRARYPDGEGYEGRLPVLSVRYEDALAYCMWCSTRDGVPYRLPTELEWERAARGADGRFFPWGNRFDANFCKMVGSRAVEAQPEPVGAFPYDRSPFDVLDLAGGVREWVDSAGDDTYAIVRGGYWSGDARSARCASRWRCHRQTRVATIGFRMVYSLRSSGV